MPATGNLIIKGYLKDLLKVMSVRWCWSWWNNDSSNKCEYQFLHNRTDAELANQIETGIIRKSICTKVTVLHGTLDDVQEDILFDTIFISM